LSSSSSSTHWKKGLKDIVIVSPDAGDGSNPKESVRVVEMKRDAIIRYWIVDSFFCRFGRWVHSQSVSFHNSMYHRYSVFRLWMVHPPHYIKYQHYVYRARQNPADWNDERHFWTRLILIHRRTCGSGKADHRVILIKN